jgi:hypothetical protein
LGRDFRQHADSDCRCLRTDERTKLQVDFTDDPYVRAEAKFDVRERKLRWQKGDAISVAKMEPATAKSATVFDEEESVRVSPPTCTAAGCDEPRIGAHDASRHQIWESKGILLPNLRVGKAGPAFDR